MNFLKFKIILPILIGITASLSISIFFISLEWAQSIRSEHSWLIYLLPFSGCLLVYLFTHYGKEAHQGTHLIIEEIHQPKNKVPLNMAVLIFGSSVFSHLFGASVGREGAAVQISASIADSIASVFKPNSNQRKIILTAGIAAGFSAALGAPFAGSLFAMEVLHVRRVKINFWIECVLAAFTAHFGVKLLKVSHLPLSPILIPEFSNHLALSIVLSALLFGIVARVFIKSLHTIDDRFLLKLKNIYLRPIIGGVLLVVFYSFYDFSKFEGLGLDLIQNSFLETSSWFVPIGKFISTEISLLAGFKGGEFIPLVIIGSTLGSALAGLLAVSIPFLASLGFVSVFAAAANTPMACTVLAIELFGPDIGIWAFVSCMLAYFISGPKSIYKTQREN